MELDIVQFGASIVSDKSREIAAGAGGGKELTPIGGGGGGGIEG